VNEGVSILEFIVNSLVTMTNLMCQVIGNDFESGSQQWWIEARVHNT